MPSLKVFPTATRRSSPSPRPAGARLNVALYYSGWHEKFRSAFATQARDNGAVPFIQIEPAEVSLAAIVAGVYDTYLETFATSVASYGAKTGQGVIIGFGHEMNGYWYPWGYRHTSPRVFVAAWRHIVTVFRQQGADNVTWLWTVNIIDKARRDSVPGALVAGQLVCDLGRDRRLLPQADLDVRFPVRADHQGRARADPRPDPHRRDRRRASRRPASEDR